MTDEEKKQHEDNAIEGSAMGASFRIPSAWTASVGPYIKWPIIAISAGVFFVLICYGLRLVVK